MTTTPTIPTPAATTKPAVPVSTAPAKVAVPVKPAPAVVKAVVPAGTVIKPEAAPAFKIKTRDDRVAARYVKFLIYADYGVGKTYLAGTAANVPQMNDILAVSAESGDLTWDTDDSGKNQFEKIDSISVTDYKTAVKIFDFLKLHCKYRDVETPEANDELVKLQAKFMGMKPEDIKVPRRYRTVIIDSLTEIEIYCMMQLLNVTDKTSLADEAQTAEWAEYKKQHTMVQRLVRAYRDLPMNVIFVCSRTYVQDETKRFLYSPAMTGKLASQIQGFMDIVGYLVTVPHEDGKSLLRRLHVQPTGKFAAKCRLSNYRKPFWDDPTMAGILKDVGMLKT